MLRKEFAMGDEERRKRIVSMLNIIVHRADTETREKIKHDFLEILENLYEDLDMKNLSSYQSSPSLTRLRIKLG